MICDFYADLADKTKYSGDAIWSATRDKIFSVKVST